MIWRVPFRISGYIEIVTRTRNADDALEQAHDTSLRDLVDEPNTTVDFEVPECQE